GWVPLSRFWSANAKTTQLKYLESICERCPSVDIAEALRKNFRTLLEDTGEGIMRFPSVDGGVSFLRMDSMDGLLSAVNLDDLALQASPEDQKKGREAMKRIFKKSDSPLPSVRDFIDLFTAGAMYISEPSSSARAGE